MFLCRPALLKALPSKGMAEVVRAFLSNKKITNVWLGDNQALVML